MNPVSNFFDPLPPELVLYIFSFLPSSALTKCKTVCKKWHSWEKDIEQMLFKKLTCVVNATLLDLHHPFFGKDEITAIRFATAHKYYIGHLNTGISYWKLSGANSQLIAKNPLYSSVTHIELAEDLAAVCGDRASVVDIVDTDSLERQCFTKTAGILSSITFDSQNSRVYHASGEGDITIFSFEDEGDKAPISQIIEKQLNLHYIAFMAMGNDSVIAACNALDADHPSSFIGWMNEEGEIVNRRYTSTHTISSFMLFKNKTSLEEEKIFFAYFPSTIVVADLNKKALFRFQLFSLVPKAEECMHFSILWDSYLAVYLKGSVEGKVFLFDLNTLSPCYQFNITNVLAGEALVNFSSDFRAAHEVIVTTDKRVLHCTLNLSEKNEQLHEEKIGAKRKRTGM